MHAYRALSQVYPLVMSALRFACSSLSSSGQAASDTTADKV